MPTMLPNLSTHSCPTPCAYLQDLACETVEDQLNVAFVVKPECEVQTVFHNTLLDMAQR